MNMKDKKGIMTTRVLEMAKDYDAPQYLIQPVINILTFINDTTESYPPALLEAVVELAEYCNVSIDYLLGRSDKYWL